MPTLVKDRPICADDSNAVIMKFNKFRHFHMPADATAFADKRPAVVWRGDLNNPKRTRFLDAVRDLPFCDAGSHKPYAPAEYSKPFPQASANSCVTATSSRSKATTWRIRSEMDPEFEFALPDAVADIRDMVSGKAT